MKKILVLAGLVPASIALIALLACGVEARVESKPTTPEPPPRFTRYQTGDFYSTLYVDNQTQCQFLETEHGQHTALVYIPCTCAKEACSKN